MHSCLTTLSALQDQIKIRPFQILCKNAHSQTYPTLKLFIKNNSGAMIWEMTAKMPLLSYSVFTATHECGFQRLHIVKFCNFCERSLFVY